MDKLLFTALSGARRTLMSQQVQANNLANVNTTGFRADLSRRPRSCCVAPVTKRGHWSVSKRWARTFPVARCSVPIVR
ncbi:flagellar basal body protein [Plesiomonas shigelloides subsp. oncorhynchi]|nr:flagellar basal body protein [Plesiomonas shigelloides]